MVKMLALFDFFMDAVGIVNHNRITMFDGSPLVRSLAYDSQ